MEFECIIVQIWSRLCNVWYFFQREKEHFAHLACLPPTARLDHQHASTQWPLLRVMAFNLSPPLLHLQHLSSRCTIPWLPLVSILSLYQPPHMLCWHVACCVCQLVNARCTAADKDQKDITNNRLLTGERDTQVPPRKPPPQLTRLHPPTIHLPALCPHLLPTPTTFTLPKPLHSKTFTLHSPR